MIEIINLLYISLKDGDFMYMYDLEKDLKDNKNKFKNDIIKEYQNSGMENVIHFLKKSGICINPFGTGKPKDSALFKEIIQDLYTYEPSSKILKQFEEEVHHINNLYKQFMNKFIKKIETTLPSEIHVVSYLVALELYLTNFQQTSNSIGITNGLNNNKSDIYENIIQMTGLVLKYFAYKKFPFKGVSCKINRQNILNAVNHLNSSEIRCLLDTILELWNYFDTEVTFVENQLKIKAIGEHALAKHISHLTFMDIRAAKIHRHSIEQVILKRKFFKTSILPPNNFISSDEMMACEFMQKYFSISDLSIEIDDISLAEYLRAYSVVARECKKFIRNRKRLDNSIKKISLDDVCICKTKYTWINYFVDVGIRKKKAEKILEFMTFDNTSNDLFDCPFIKIDDEYVLIPTASFLTDSARTIMLNMCNRGIDVSIKGHRFESLIRKTLSMANVKFINLEKKDYECDTVFAMGNDLFFVELKNLNYPTTYREYIRNIDEIHQACIQLERIVRYYSQEKNISIIKDRLNIEKINSIYKIVVTNTSQGEKLVFNETYVTDATIFTGYFERRPPQLVEVEQRVLTTKPLFEHYYLGDLNTKQFIELIEKNPLVEQNKRRIKYQTFDYKEQLGVMLTDFAVKVNSFVFPDFLSKHELNELNEVYNFKI